MEPAGYPAGTTWVVRFGYTYAETTTLCVRVRNIDSGAVAGEHCLTPSTTDFINYDSDYGNMFNGQTEVSLPDLTAGRWIVDMKDSRYSGGGPGWISGPAVLVGSVAN